MQTDQNKVLNKIKKCLRMAASSNANEAATALRQAQALMAQHSVTLTDIQAAEANSHIIRAGVIAKPSAWEAELAWVAASAFGCELIFVHSPWTSLPGGWKFIGIDVAPELAGYAFGVLLRQIKRDRAAYIKTSLKRCKTTTKTKRAGIYCKGWVFAVKGKITAIAPGVAEKTAIDAYMEKYHSTRTILNPRNSKGRGNDNDRIAGYLAGRDATLNRGVEGGAATTQLEYQS